MYESDKCIGDMTIGLFVSGTVTVVNTERD
jgi:hypothetical protein